MSGMKPLDSVFSSEYDSASLIPSNLLPNDSSVSNANANTDSTTKRNRNSKLCLKKTRDKKNALKNASTSSISSTAKPKSTSWSSKPKSAEHNSSSKQVTNVQITSIDQINTFMNLNGAATKNTELTIPADVLLQWVATQQHQCDTSSSIPNPSSKSAKQKNALCDISNLCNVGITQEQMKEISQETDDSQFEIMNEIVVDKDPVYRYNVSTEPFSEEIVKKKLLSAGQFPDITASDCSGSEEEIKAKVINNFRIYNGVLQKAELNRYTNMEYQERKDLPQKKIKFANGDEIDLPETLVHSLFGPDGKPKWASEVYLLTKEDAINLKTVFDLFGWAVPPLCGDLSAGLAALQILFIEIGTFQCPEDTTTRLNQVEVIKHLSRIVEGAPGKVGFCNVEHFLPMVHSKFLSYYARDKHLAITKFKDNVEVQQALQVVEDALSIQREATEFIMKYVQQPAFLKLKETYPNLNCITGSNFSSKNTHLIGIETQFILDCMQGKLDEQEDKELTKLQEEYLKKCQSKYSKKSCINGSCDFVDMAHICSIQLGSGATKDDTKEAYKKDIAKKAHCIGNVIDINYSPDQMDLQLFQRDKKQSMSNMTQFLFLYGIGTKDHDKVQQISTARRLESTRNNALARGEDVQDGYVQSNQTIRRRVESDGGRSTICSTGFIRKV